MALEITGAAPQAFSNANQAALLRNDEDRGPAGTDGTAAQNRPADQASTVALSGFDVAGTQALTAAEIVNGINASLAPEGIRLDQVNPEEFTPEAVVNNILRQVQEVVTGLAGNEEEARDLLAQAREGIAQGIEQAREVLDSFNALNEDIEQGINATRTLLDEGLTQLEETITQIFNPAGEEQERPQPRGEEQTLQTQVVQSAVGSQQNAELGQAQVRARPTF